MKPNLLAATALLLGVSVADANDLKPVEAKHVDLGSTAGVAYFTIEPDGFHVVVTLARNETDAHPIRFQTVLSAGQDMTLSTAGDWGTAPSSVRIARFGDRVIVHGGVATEDPDEARVR